MSRLQLLIRRLKSIFFPASKEEVRSAAIGENIIETSTGHPLASYLSTYPLYDQFVPSICRVLNGVVIDIGANVGDTMASIISSNDNLRVLCVEPDPHFYSILERNRIAIDKYSRVTTHRAFISNRNDGFAVVKNATNSTGNIELVPHSEASAPSLSITQLIAAEELPNPSFIKSDTDGFDADILQSVADHIESHSSFAPILFFEMQTYLQNVGFNDDTRGARQQDYFAAVRRLASFGYKYLTIIDNFGTPIFRHTDLNTLISLEKYILASQVRNRHATIYFVDVVLYKETQLPLIENVLNQLLGVELPVQRSCSETN